MGESCRICGFRKWKTRQGQAKAAYKELLHRGCGDDPDARLYLDKAITKEIMSILKPFGRVLFGMGRSLALLRFS